MQHGSAPAALAVWAAERIPTREPMRIARVTIDLMRPVPVAPLTLESEVLREGRKIQLCAIRLRAGNAVVVSSNVLKIKTQALQLPPEAGDIAVELPGPEIGGTLRLPALVWEAYTGGAVVVFANLARGEYLKLRDFLNHFG